MKGEWVVYLLECSDGTLYCGISNNLKKRIEAHNNGKGAKYTRGRLPVRLKASISVWTKGKAISVERKVKRANRERKIDVLLSNGDFARAYV